MNIRYVTAAEAEMYRQRRGFTPVEEYLPHWIKDEPGEIGMYLGVERDMTPDGFPIRRLVAAEKIVVKE